MNIPEKIGFVLSTGRTGTKTLAEGLAGDDIVSSHQPPFSRLLTVASNYYLHGWLPRRALEWLVLKTRCSQINRANCRWYIQAFSLDHLPAKIISQRYPNVHIVHIVRDPRTFVPSYINWIHSRFKSYVANKWVLGWHPSGFFTGDFEWKKWHRMDEFQRICWHWTFKNILLENLFGGYDFYIRLRFEDLFYSNYTQALQQLLNFLNIPYQNKYNIVLRQEKNQSSQSYFPAFEQWGVDLQEHLYQICGTLMDRYGYLN